MLSSLSGKDCDPCKRATPKRFPSSMTVGFARRTRRRRALFDKLAKNRPGLKTRATHGSPYGTQENETAVPEGTTVGSPGFQSRAVSGVALPILRDISKRVFGKRDFGAVQERGERLDPWERWRPAGLQTPFFSPEREQKKSWLVGRRGASAPRGGRP